MADPFSAIASALTIGDLCLKVSNYLGSIAKTSKNIESELEALRTEIDTFSRTFTSLSELCDSRSITSRYTTRPPCDNLWGRATDLIQQGQNAIEKLESLAKSVLASKEPPKLARLDGVFKAFKLEWKQDDFKQLRLRLKGLNTELGTMFSAIDLASNVLSHEQTSSSLQQLPLKVAQEFQKQGLQLKTMIRTLEETEDSPESSISPAREALKYASLNKHFYIQKPDTHLWTGRSWCLDKARDAFFSAVKQRFQKRFVVHGISGSGKTQFSCKFAQEYRESFWGIFWVDASNPQSTSESWKRIAKIGTKDSNENAGKYWLSNLHSPWLLIIDGADLSEKAIQNHFPTGEMGCVLITTRNPRMNINATVGSLTLDRLDEAEANELLRKATQHQPWDLSAVTSASSIAKHLGYLPLALVHAGRTIFHKLCTLQDYIPFFDQTMLDFHKRRRAVTLYTDDDEDDVYGPFTSFDIIYLGMDAKASKSTAQGRAFRDATELINVFSFIHNIDIPLDLIIRAGRNIPSETEERRNLRSMGDPNQGSTFQKILDVGKAWVVRLRAPTPALPDLLKVSDGKRFDEGRARKAVDLLVQLSLLSESSERGSYSMHPLVHLWTRARLSTSVQALWCGTAASVVSASIKSIASKEAPGDQEYYLRLLPHVDKIIECQKTVGQDLLRNASQASYLRRLLWMSNPLKFRAVDAINGGKYARVYMQCLQFEAGERLLRQVLKYAVDNLGPKHPILVPISLGLATALWHTSQPAEAQALQEDALKICQSTFGDNDSQTLKVMDSLGRTYWQRGWLKEAKGLHESAIAGMKGKPDMEREMLNAMVHLGHVHEWYLQNEDALKTHEVASRDLETLAGPDDLDTLSAKDSLAMILLQISSAENAKRANAIMQDVYDRRLKLLGPENLVTLWAMCNLARTLTARGQLEQDPGLIQDAKDMFDDGLAICIRNHGAEHIGTLMGRRARSNALEAENKFAEAEKEYKDIAELQKTLPGARAGTHRDRVVTLQDLVICYEKQGKIAEAIAACDTVVREMDDMGGQKHPTRIRMADRKIRLLAISS